MKLVSFRKYSKDSELGYFDIGFDIEIEGIVIKGFRLEKRNDYRIKFPSMQGKDGKVYTIAYPADDLGKERLTQLAKEAYKKVKEISLDEKLLEKSKADDVIKDNQKSIEDNREQERKREEKLRISHGYIDNGFGGSREDVKRMRGQRLSGVRHRSRGYDK
jgi:hypothetical protein